MRVRSQIILEKFKKQLTNDIIEALDEKVVWPDIDGTLVPNLVKKIIGKYLGNFFFIYNV